MARRRRPLFARWYPRLAASLEERGLGDRRRRLLASLRGRVLEVGCGHGVNFAHYPEVVTELVAIEPEAHLRDLARERAAALGRDVTVLDGRAEALPVETDSFDAVVTTLVLCSVEDPDQALAEIHRVLAPGGALVCLEHVASANRAIRLGEHVFDTVFWSHAFGGCHTGRDTRAAIVRAGLRLEGLHARRYPDLPFPLSVSPHLIGTARKSAGSASDGGARHALRVRAEDCVRRRGSLRNSYFRSAISETARASNPAVPGVAHGRNETAASALAHQWPRAVSGRCRTARDRHQHAEKLFVACAVFALMFATTSTAWAGSSHFLKVSYSVSGDTLTVEGKEAGLGNEESVHIEVDATAECVNRGGNNPNASNKTDVSGGEDFPVQNGKALFSITLTADFTPDCSPPMKVVYTSITVTDTTHGISKTLL